MSSPDFQRCSIVRVPELRTALRLIFANSLTSKYFRSNSLTVVYAMSPAYRPTSLARCPT